MYVALLRGVNVGGKHILPMKDLASLFAKEGCTGVRTYIQSGNVVFEAESGKLFGLAGRISERILGRFGFTTPVVIRTGAEIRQVIKSNPFLGTDSREEMLHVYFLSTNPSKEDVARLDHGRSVPDLFEVRGKDIFLHIPRGMGYTKLTNAYFDSTLHTTSTCRNWRTVLKLAEMAGV